MKNSKPGGTQEQPVTTTTDARRRFLTRAATGAAVGLSQALVGCGGTANAASSSCSPAAPAVLDIPAGIAHSINTTDGIKLAAREYGNPAGKPILLIHGYSGSYLSWFKQFSDPALTSRYRVIALDVRGHGDSEKPPTGGTAYLSNQQADDVKAVMDQLRLVAPCLVGWSFGGIIINDYVRKYGTGNVGSINYVDAPTRLNLALQQPQLAQYAFFSEFVSKVLPDTLSGDLATLYKGLQTFVSGMTGERPMSDADFALAMAINHHCPSSSRLGLISRPPEEFDTTVMPLINVPVLITHGELDNVILVGQADVSAKAIPGSKKSIYAGKGHVCFQEDSSRFNAELAKLVG